MAVALLTTVTRWHCPACGLRQETREVRPHSRFHTCPKLRGLSAPMLRDGAKGKLELHEREDYVGGELVALDPERRRPVMSLVTTRDDGQDTTVFAPTATLGADIGRQRAGIGPATQPAAASGTTKE